MTNFFTLTEAEMAAINAIEGVEWFREILLTEAHQCGVPLQNVNISTVINIPDGGIDACVNNDTPNHSQFFPNGYTGFQIKVGSSWTGAKSELRNELIKDNNLKPKIRECMERDGTYVLVFFNKDQNIRQDNDVKNDLIEIFKEFGFSNPKVQFWHKDHIKGYFEKYPALCLLFKKTGNFPFQTYSEWANTSEMSKSFIPPAQFEEFAQNLNNDLANQSEAIHLRVNDAPGSGKSRFVCESLRNSPLRPIVLYSDRVEDVIAFSFLEQFCRNATYQLILVLDECTQEQAYIVWNKLKSHSHRIKLITIYNVPDNGNLTGVRHFKLPKMEEDNIVAILQNYVPLLEEAQKWAQFVENSPRFAHMVGYNLGANPEDITEPVDRIYERILEGAEKKDSDLAQKRKLVIEYISLFLKFGHEKPVENESAYIFSLIQKVDSGFGKTTFDAIIMYFQHIKVLQGYRTLYITPRILHIYFWRQWWEKHARNFEINDFISTDPTLLSTIPENLSQWFINMFDYAKTSVQASKIVRELLSKEGPFYQNSLLKSKLGADFFLTLSKVDPLGALELLKNQIGTKSVEQLKEFTTGRRDVVWALERIVEHREYFDGAAKLLKILALSENESYSNNATGIFTDLFSWGYGDIAPTEVPPMDRLYLLAELFDSDEESQFDLGLKCLDKALETRPFGRITQYHVFETPPQLWQPQTYGEIYEYLNTVWHYASDLLSQADNATTQEKIIKLLTSNARSLAKISQVGTSVFETLESLSQKSQDPLVKELILGAISQILTYDYKEYSEDELTKWTNLKNRLYGDDFSSRLKRYVGTNIFEEEYARHQIKEGDAYPELQQLSKEALENIDLFENELDWLVTPKAKTGIDFGLRLARTDQSHIFFHKIIKAQKSHAQLELKEQSALLLSGYLRQIHDENIQKWEDFLTEIANDCELVGLFPEILWRSGVSENMMRLFLKLSKENKIPIWTFYQFSYGGYLNDAPQDVFFEWLDYLIDVNSQDSILSALNLVSAFYYKEKAQNLPEKYCRNILLSTVFQQPDFFKKTSTMHHFYWAKLAEHSVTNCPALLNDLFLFVFQNSRIKDGFFSNFGHNEIQGFMNFCAKRYPKETWGVLSGFLESAQSSYKVRTWLRGSINFDGSEDKTSPIMYFDREDIWSWLEKNPNQASLVASFLPINLLPTESQPSMMRELLARFGNDEKVQDVATSNFLSGSWSGSAVVHYQNRLTDLETFLASESNPQVLGWGAKMRDYLQAYVERSREDEERRGY